MTIALKVGVFTQFIQGYVINIGIKLFQRQFVDPNRIEIQNFIAKIKAARGLKSAQDTTLVNRYKNNYIKIFALSKN
jgi:hypothetical protein